MPIDPVDQHPRPATTQAINPARARRELDKVAANIAVGRNMAGVHWQSDYRESIDLGQNVALCILQRQTSDYFEDFAFSVTLYDGTRVTVNKDGVKKDAKSHPVDGCTPAPARK